MVGYKIIYGKRTYDCWGSPEFVWVGNYNDTIYLDKEACIKEINELNSIKGYDYGFGIKEVSIVEKTTNSI